MTFEEWGDVLRIAATIWPQTRSFFDDPPDAERTPTRTWWAALCQFETDDVLAALGRLGMTSRYWPSLAEVVDATREVVADRVEQRRRKRLDRARLPVPLQGTVAERLAVFDHTAVAVHRERRDELSLFAEQSGRFHADANLLSDPANRIGEWARRLRDLIAHGWPQ